jgi:hypothetical protein
MITVDAATLGANTNMELKDAIKKQNERHEEGTKATLVIKDGVDRLHEGQEQLYQDLVLREQRRTILEWITPIDYAPRQNYFISRRQAGTGQWLLDLEKYQAWLDTNRQTIFCTGFPGAGKTIITSIVIDHLTSRVRDKSIGIAFVYCEFRRQHEQTPEHILRSLLRQLVRDQPSMLESVKRLYDDHKKASSSPSTEDITKLLHSVAMNYSQVFILIDALDECPDPKKLMNEIINLQAQTGANLFTTSRPGLGIEKKFKVNIFLFEINAKIEDVEKYLDAHMSDLLLLQDDEDLSEDEDLPENLKVEIKAKIKREITQAANGM